MLLSVIVPAYNEGKNIVSTIKNIYNFFSTRPFLYVELILVDDCSNDQTIDVIKNLIRQYPTLKYLRNEKNRGKGFSVKRGMTEANGDYALFMDADLSTPLDQFDILWKNIVNADIVIASRALPESVILKHQTKLKERIAKMGNRAIRFFLGLSYRDTQCGFKLFTKKAKGLFQFLTIERWGFDMELLYIAKKRGQRVAEVPVVWINDPTSLVRRIDYAIVFCDIFKIIGNNILGRYDVNLKL